MKYFLAVCLTFCLGGVKAQDDFVLIELFTSQGCSSCPAADKNLSEILNSENSGAVIGLSFHVDYWNYIGWKDPYSDKKFSERQRQYAKKLGVGVYTPQMIVNGKEVFVGSYRRKTLEAKSNKQQNEYEIILNDVSIDKNFVTFKYTLDREPGNEALCVALVERDIKNYVSRGENSGRTLHHDNIVRVFETLSLRKSSTLKLPLNDVVIEKSKLVLYVQDKNLSIVAAASRSLK
jgi:hypothetical protein